MKETKEGKRLQTGPCSSRVNLNDNLIWPDDCACLALAAPSRTMISTKAG